ncbi:MAG: hypothetical protein O7A03_11015 [Alphaproteobacteria bacterium]|nr:hypothetical protein [Alphaproteobacteria bacterium]
MATSASRRAGRATRGRCSAPGSADKDSHPELLEAARAAFALISGSVAANVSDGAGTADRAPVVTIAAWALVHGRTTLVVVRQIRPALNSPAA